MKTGKYQFVGLVAIFSFGFFFQDFISDGPVVDDVYYQDTPELLQCTINIDCDNYYDLKILFPGEEVPDNKIINRLLTKMREKWYIF